MKKLITIILALTLVMGLSVAGASAKAKKPAKVTALKATSQKYQITLTWKKAKRAKKYQVYQLSGKKFVKVKTTKARKAVFTNLKMDTAYKFKVRGIKGKKKGKFSKVITVRTKKSTFHPVPVNPTEDKNVKINEGDTYIIETDSGAKAKVTFTVAYTLDGRTNYEGHTEDGGYYAYTKNKNFESYELWTLPCENNSYDWNNTYDDEWMSDVRQLTVKDDSKFYWALDGTEPKIGQADLFGSSELVPFHKSTSDYTVVYKETQLRGTSAKGFHNIKIGDRYINKEMKNWFKGYDKNGKLIYESKYHQFDHSD